jgi:protein phosphatase
MLNAKSKQSILIKSHSPDFRDQAGPFDVIGDVHGCIDELTELLSKLGYGIDGHRVTPPVGRRLVFVGDLIDRGPDSVAVLRLAMDMVNDGTAFCVPGNHDAKLLKKLQGRNVQLLHGLDKTLAQLGTQPPEFSAQVKAFFESLPNHLILDGGRLVIAHAGIREDMIGRMDDQVRSFVLFGDTTGETDEYGLPVRRNWAAKYKGKALVVYGHTPQPEPLWLNNTVNIDTGCVFGGALTALRYPERELVSVPAKWTYAQSTRPIAFANPAPLLD